MVHVLVSNSTGQELQWNLAYLKRVPDVEEISVDLSSSDELSDFNDTFLGFNSDTINGGVIQTQSTAINSDRPATIQDVVEGSPETYSSSKNSPFGG